MSKIVPPSRPAQTKTKTLHTLGSHGVVAPVALLGMRGYYLDSMGVPGRNDRGIYDDAIFLCTPSAHVSFNANTDPSIYREGIASLQPGRWLYKVGTHGLSKPVEKRYKALVQAEPVTVSRDNEKDETGWFGINIHKGSFTGTSSLGCQTIFPTQWDAFIALVCEELQRYNQKTVPYLLIA